MRGSWHTTRNLRPPAELVPEEAIVAGALPACSARRYEGLVERPDSLIPFPQGVFAFWFAVIHFGGGALCCYVSVFWLGRCAPKFEPEVFNLLMGILFWLTAFASTGCVIVACVIDAFRGTFSKASGKQLLLYGALTACPFVILYFGLLLS